MNGPLELVGDPDGAVCADGLCALPAPQDGQDEVTPEA